MEDRLVHTFASRMNSGVIPSFQRGPYWSCAPTWVMPMLLMKEEVCSSNGKAICHFLGKEQNASEWTAAALLLGGLSRVTPGSAMGKQSERMEMSDPMVSLRDEWPLILKLPFILRLVPGHGSYLVLLHNPYINGTWWQLLNENASFKRKCASLNFIGSLWWPLVH